MRFCQSGTTVRTVWIVLSSLGILLQLLLIAEIPRGAWKRFKALSAYLLVLFLTTVIEAAAFYDPEVYARTWKFYWLHDAIRQALIYVVVLSFIHKSLERNPGRTGAKFLIWGGGAFFLIVSIVAAYDPRKGYWMTNLSRNLGFLAVVLNFLLWAVLMQERKKDRVLLMLTGAMGLQMAGKAIGHALRLISKTLVTPGDFIIVFCHIVCLYGWLCALRIDRSRAPGLE